MCPTTSWLAPTEELYPARRKVVPTGHVVRLGLVVSGPGSIRTVKDLTNNAE